MKCNDCKNFKAEEVKDKSKAQEKALGVCTITNTVCGPEDECNTALLDKTGAI